jgi:4-amino-4-deoxy-L-arabinose transferase-like glycosyltransferase
MRSLIHKHFYQVSFIIVLLLALFLRFYQLGITAPSLTWDEVAWGYNAYALGIDGKDEFGRFLPYDYLESFGDFKPPLYAYVTIIPVMIFGLTEFAVRFPSALFGTLTVFLTYFLVQRIFFRSPQKELYGVLSAFLLAVSPWHIMLSRAAFEANVASFFLVLGVFLFLKGVQEKPYFLIGSAVSFVSTFYTFNSSRIVVPLLVIILAIGFWKKLLVMKKYVSIAAIVGFLLLLPIIPFLLSSQASLRFKEVNIFTDSQVVETANQEIHNDGNAAFSKVLHNRRIAYGREFLKHYFDNMSPAFLFITGDENPKFSIQTIGQLFFWQLPFLVLLGGLYLFKKREGHWWIIPLWLLISIIPAATARETPHALRTETALPTWQILEAYGLVALGLLLQKKKLLWRNIFIGVVGVISLFNVSFFVHDYFVHYPTLFSGPWQYGYREAIRYANTEKDTYDHIYLTQSFGRPYIYTLFYTQYSPESFRKSAEIERDPFGFVHVLGFDKYRFGDNDSDTRKQLAGQKNVLYIDDPKQVPKNAQVKKKFYFLDGSIALVAYTIK